MGQKPNEGYTQRDGKSADIYGNKSEIYSIRFHLKDNRGRAFGATKARRYRIPGKLRLEK